MQSHDEYLALCALSTSGELTDDEHRKLRDHLAGCSDCRKALKEFETVADIGLPLLSSHLGAEAGSAGELRVDVAPAAARQSKRASAPTTGANPSSAFISRAASTRNSSITWNQVWIPLAACVILSLSLALYSYQAGRRQAPNIARATAIPSNSDVEKLEGQISDLGQESALLGQQIAERDRTIADLHKGLAAQTAALGELTTEKDTLEATAQSNDTKAQQAFEDRATLNQKLDSAEASLEQLRGELDAARSQNASDNVRTASLEVQMKDLLGQLKDTQQTVSSQQDLLDHDRDIRDLMGARDLYIAEVYDVARDGTTQKPFGRIFYTKGKSLIFYAYDLDRQSGAKSASTFQAWGRRDGDSQDALNLGVFYQDNTAKKRWVLKSDDPVALEQINAVFVTVEPNGGSARPSGKPLLFAYLKIEPNHP
jgi:Putative zinc-finger